MKEDSMEVEQKSLVARTLADNLEILDNVSASESNIGITLMISGDEYHFNVTNDGFKGRLRDFLKLELTNRIKELEANYFVQGEK